MDVRSDLAFIAKEMGRVASCPVVLDEMRLHRVMRYIRGTSDFVLTIQLDELVGNVPRIHVFCDANWADKDAARRSTMGVVCFLDGMDISITRRLEVLLTSQLAKPNLVRWTLAQPRRFMFARSLKRWA